MIEGDSSSPRAQHQSRNAWIVLIVAALLTLASLFALLHAKPETSVAGLLDPGDPAVVALGKVLDHFPVVEEMLVLVSVPSDFAGDAKSELLQSAERFEALTKSDAEAETLISVVRHRASPQMARFVQETIVPHGLDYLGDDAFAQLTARLNRPTMDAQFQQNRAMLAVPGPAAGEMAKAFIRDPLRLRDLLIARLGHLGSVAPTMSGGAFFSADGRSLLIRISGTKPPADLEFCRQITRVVNRLADQATGGKQSVQIAGAYAVAAHSVDAIRWDSIVGVNMTILAIAVLFGALYRRPIRQFFFTFIPMSMGLAWGFGVYAMTHATFTPLAAVVGGALGGVGIDYGVFFLAHHDRERHRAGVAAASASRTTLSRLRWPLLAAWATSAVGFLAIGASPIRVLRDFAIVGTLALLGAYLATITVLPAALALLDRRRADASSASARLTFIAPVGRFIAGRPRAVLTAAAMLWLGLVGSLFVGSSLLPDANLLSLHPQPNPPLLAQRAISTRMGIAPGTVQLYLEAKTPDQLLRTAHAVERSLAEPQLAKAGMTGAFGIAALLPDPATSERRRATIDPSLAERAGRDLLDAAAAAGFATKPFEPSAAFLRTLLVPTTAVPGVESLRAFPEIGQLLLSHDAIAGDPPTDSLVTVFFDNPLDRRDARDAALKALRAALDGMPGVTITGMSAINDHVTSAIYRDLPRLIAGAIACIALCLWLHFRSLKLAALAVLPTVVSITVVLVFMRAAGLPLDLVNMIMVPLLIGIDVDYSILTISAWRSARSREELLAAFPTTATAVITCVATTLVGFGSLVLTSIPAVRSLGTLITIGVISCLTASMVVLWPILFLTKPRVVDAK